MFNVSLCLGTYTQLFRAERKWQTALYSTITDCNMRDYAVDALKEIGYQKFNLAVIDIFGVLSFFNE